MRRFPDALTLGIFDENILEITRLVHEADGLCYYDGANLNAVMGVVRPDEVRAARNPILRYQA